MAKNKSLDTRKDKIRVVTKNNFITAIGEKKLSLKAKKLLYIALSQVKKNDKDFFDFKLTPIEFACLMGVDVSNLYREMEGITDELVQLAIRCDTQNNDIVRKYSVFSYIEYGSNSDITFKLNSDMTEFLLALKRDFTQPLLDDFMKMNSTYSMAVWHLMQREMKSQKPYADVFIEFELTLEELRIATGTTDKLKQLVEFKKNILDKAIREIYENCNVDIKYTNIKTGRMVTGFHFIAKSWNYIPPNKRTIQTQLKLQENKTL